MGIPSKPPGPLKGEVWKLLEFSGTFIRVIYEAYRYGFNGKEKDNEVEGEGNIYDYGFRIYNPRTAKFLSADPLSKSFPWNSPYAYAEGNPVNYVDLDGLETPTLRAQAARPIYSPTIAPVVAGEGRIQKTAQPLNLTPGVSNIDANSRYIPYNKLIPPYAMDASQVDNNTILVTGANGNSWYESLTVPAYKPTKVDFSIPDKQYNKVDQNVVAFQNFKNSITSDKPTPLVEQKPLPNFSPANQNLNSKPSVSTEQDDNNSGKIYLIRRGPDPETKEKLAADAIKAASVPKFGHGVSTTIKSRISGTDKKANRSALLSDVSKIFTVKPTPTVNDPKHVTVILPNPVTKEVADKFNSLFKTKE